MIIRGKSLVLRPACEKDLELYRQWWTGLELMRNYDLLPPPTYHQLEQEHKRNLRSHNRRDFIMEDLNRQPFGLIYLKNIHWKDRHAELHTLVAGHGYQHLGFGIEAQYYIMRHAYYQLNLNKLYGRVFEYARDNIKLMEFVGYRKEAVCKQAVFHKGRYWDLYIFGLLRREFDAFLAGDKREFITYAETT